jgi:3-deoxy-7-phosphoheptulonate synthase
MIDNKFPGKDITTEDLKTKFPLAAKKNSKHKTIVKINDFEIGGKDMPIFAGPNMVESFELMEKTAKFLKKHKLNFMRGGAFKPLTFPYRSSVYTETREKGIEYFRQAKFKNKTLIITELMELKHLDLICEVADIIQIGARNMQNFPFLTEVAKTKKPIMLKRHFGASLRDLLGAAEYILVEGNKNLLLCERGVVVPHTHLSSSRYLLDITAIIALKEYTHLPIISDPSHASFYAPWVPDLTMASIAAGADGIMLEVHPDPKNAKVDSLQTLDFKQFEKLILKIRKISKFFNKRAV